MPCDFVPEREKLKTFRKLDVHKRTCFKKRNKTLAGAHYRFFVQCFVLK
jgi:hypothetical protein